MKKTLKKLLVCTLAAALSFSTVSAASAAQSPAASVEPETQKAVKTEKTNGIIASVDTTEDGTASLGTIAKTSKKSVVVAAKVTVNGVSYKVTVIKANAFKNCKKATSVTLPNTIKTISANAFKGAKALKTITLKSTKAITVKKGAFKGLNTKKMTIKVSKKMSKKELNKLKKTLKKAGFKGKVKKA